MGVMQTTSLRRRAQMAVGGVFLAGAVAVAGISAPSAHAAGPNQVELKALKFTPDKLTVKPNTSVTWVWKEKVAHNLLFDDKTKSKTQTKGVYVRRFTKAGTYKYHCTLHPTMKGQVVV